MCCIYHKQRGFDESDSEDSSDSDSSSDEGEGGEPEGGSRHDHNHNHHRRKEDKNAYERMPRAREKGKTPGGCLCAKVDRILIWSLGVNQA